MAHRPLLALAALLVGAGLAAPATARDRSTEPEIVVVQHILIGFKRSVQGKKIDRTKPQAGELAATLAERARAGEDFDALVKEYTDDQCPGILTLTNRGAPRRGGATTRDGVVTRFGDVSFGLEVGEIGVAAYSAAGSPYGWHVIKRLE